MTEYDELLKKVEKATENITNEDLRRIAFQRLLDHELTLHGQRTQPPTPPAKTPAVERSRRSPTKSSRAGSAINLREEVKALGISPDESELPKWASLKALDKYLWILEAAHRKHIDGLTTAEIKAMIFNVFRENHDTNQVNNLKTRLKAGHVKVCRISIGSAQVEGLQILKGGKDHLQKLRNEASGKS